MPKAPKPKSDKPNILVIWGDDIGIANFSCYSHGLMGYETPNIDRIAKEGMLFTTSTANSHAPRVVRAFITGQQRLSHRPHKGRHSRRADGDERNRSHHRRRCSRTWAMRPASSARTTSATATQSLPTVNGFDEFYGNLYHLNAEEEPEAARLSRREGVPRTFPRVRAARRDPVQGHRQG